MAATTVYITGAPPVGGVPQPRLEINDFVHVNNLPQFSLFVQALTQMQLANENDPTSYFQIAGLHGVPWVQWNGSGGPTWVNGSHEVGYCTHGTVLFPTWHRPYLALIEQIIQQHAVAIAATYRAADLPTYTDAASRLRFPYWDWARPNGSVPPPQIIQSPTVQIRAADGSSPYVTNPFLRYGFQNLDHSTLAVLPWMPVSLRQFPVTKRYPTAKVAGAASDIDALRGALGAAQLRLTQRVYFMLTQIETWQLFSNHTLPDGSRIDPDSEIDVGPQSNSLETIHDAIHGLCGGSLKSMPNPNGGTIYFGIGHMTEVTAASFDPIFFLHHANVDRLLALWSAIHPDKWVNASNETSGTWVIPPGAAITETTDLAPFWRAPGVYWNSNTSRTTDAFGYTYPEFQDVPAGEPPRGTIISHVLDLYGTGIRSSIPTSPSLPMLTSQKGRYFLSQPSVSSLGLPQSYIWTARIRLEKYALNGTGWVYIFIGPVPLDPNDWSTAPNAGHFFIFARDTNSTVNCANCQNMIANHSIIQGFVELNDEIRAANPQLASMDPALVVPYLEANLSWRVIGSEHNVPSSDVPSLQVDVSATPISWPAGDELPTYGKPQLFPEITAGRTF
ncbi:photo-regulated tyrosinase [Mycena amicta]|nr:photo-regulated tyrosinase [Mycena amicta]